MTAPLVFVDTETDGLGPSCHAWEIALIRRDEDGQREHHMFVALDQRYSDPQALAIGRFWDRHPVGRKVSGKAPLPGAQGVYAAHDAARDVMRWTFDATLVGASVHFDADVLGRLLRSQGYLPSWSYRLRCVTTLASGEAGRDVGGLDGALDYLGIAIPVTARHTAMGDARAAMAVWDAVMDGCEP